MARRSDRSDGKRRLDVEPRRFLGDVARAVIRDDLPLEHAWREHSRRHGLRDYRLGGHTDALRHALEVEVELFGGDAYQQRLRATQQTCAAVSELFTDQQLYVLGLPAIGLAAAGAQLNLVIFEDEPEAIVRLLMDRGLPYQATQQRWQDRDGGAEWIGPAFVIGTPGIDAQINVLPRRAERLPLLADGQTVWITKVDTVAGLAADARSPG